MKQLLLVLCTVLLLASCEEQQIVGVPPNSYELKQNRPNPFIDTTLIEFGIPNVSSSPPRIRISIYNRFHDRIAVLRDSSNHPAGTFMIGWKPYNNYPSGMYYIELQQITGIFQSNVVLKRIVTIKK